MTGTLGLNQKMARRLVAFSSICECLDKDGHPALLCTCDAYERVADLHKQWRLDQQKAKAKQKGK